MTKIAYPPLRTVKIGRSTMIQYDDVLRAAGRDPAAEPADRQKLIGIRKTCFELGKSRATVNRMMAAGREQTAA